MNKQTLFVKVSDTSGADMLSQNPYLQILTGGGDWNSTERMPAASVGPATDDTATTVALMPMPRPSCALG